jgi:uncharacterized membrane protein
VARGRPALLLGGLAAVGLAIALYLSANALAGTVPVCVAGGGCESVAQSQYSHWFGIPVAFFGVLFSGVLLGLIAGWWRTGDGRLLLIGYAQGLVGVVIAIYLRYLELAVIGAVCAWCVAYGATVLFGWLALLAVHRRAGRPGRQG